MKKIAYWISTGFLLFALTWSAVTYHVIYDHQASFFKAMGYPTYLVYPLAWLKVIAILVIASHRYRDLRDMVYAAYFINMLMALQGHILLGDIYYHALAGLLALPVSYLLGNQVRGEPSRVFFGRWTTQAN